MRSDISTNPPTASTSHSPVIFTKAKMAEQQESKESKGDKEQADSVPFYKLFSFADCKDIILMVLGTIFAIANGMAMPVMTLLVGDVVDSFGQNTSGKHVVHEVSKVRILACCATKFII